MHRANRILVNILCGLIVAVVAGIAANSARSEDGFEPYRGSEPEPLIVTQR